MTVSAATGSNTYVASATSVFINPQSGKSGGFQVAATSADAESGIAKINFPVLTGFSSGGGDVANPGPYSTIYAWSGAVGASGAQTVTAYNGATPALTAGSSFTVTPDITAPAGGSITANGTGSDSYNTSGTIAISTTNFRRACVGVPVRNRRKRRHWPLRYLHAWQRLWQLLR